MHFIERHLGFLPDGGDGSSEILALVVMVMIVVVGALRLTAK
jgi:flagellin-like protein